MNDINKIAVIGMGVIGSSWVTLFALKGLDVAAYSRRAETRQQGLKNIMSNLDFLVEKSVISKDDRTKAIKRISVVSKLSDAVTDADFVEECAGETYEIKKIIFNEIDRYVSKHAIIASSTSGLRMTVIQEESDNKENYIITHPFNPPHLIPLVEIVPGTYTSEQTIESTHSFMEALGKVAVIVRKEVTGFIANRLAAALWREAVDLVQKGIASVEDVDKALYAGPGIRWALMGQHLIYHLGGGQQGGIEHFIEGIGNTTFKKIWRELAAWDYITEPVKEILSSGVKDAMKEKSFQDVVKWRDDKVVDLLKIIYS